MKRLRPAYRARQQIGGHFLAALIFVFSSLSQQGTISCFDEIESEGRQVGRSSWTLLFQF